MDTKEYISSGIIEAYLLGTATAEEAGILECVMQHNTEVKAAFTDVQETLEMLATAQAIAPADMLKAKVWEKLKESGKENAGATVKNLPEKTTATTSQKWQRLAVAASLLLLASLTGVLVQRSELSGTKKEMARLAGEVRLQKTQLEDIKHSYALLSDPAMRKVVLQGVEKHPGINATVFWNTQDKKVYLQAGNLPQAPAGMQYQLWALEEGTPVSAGLYTADNDGRVPLATIANAQAFAITLEKAGGAKTPTLENLFVMGEI